MNKLIVICMATLAATQALAVYENLTPEQRETMRKVRSIPLKERIKMDGGLVALPYTGNVVRVVNAQAKVPSALVDEVCKMVGEPIGLPMCAASVPAAEPLGLVASSLKEKGNGVVIAVVDDAKLATPILVAPEGPWAIVNVRPLAAGADAETLRKRFIREFWRATAMVLGAANSTYPDCVLQTVRDMKDLDGISALVACPEHFDKMMSAARAWGVDRQKRTTYRRACELGCAPAPANEAQRQIADDVKKGLPPAYLRK